MSSAMGFAGGLMGANKTNQGLSAAEGALSSGYGQAINGLTSLLPQFQTFNFQPDPGYQFTKQQGEMGINNAAAARGNFFAPSTLQDLSRFNTGLANQTYQSAFDRWIQQNNALLNLRTGIGNYQTGRANALAQNYVAQGQNAANMWTGASNQLGQMMGANTNPLGIGNPLSSLLSQAGGGIMGLLGMGA